MACSFFDWTSFPSDQPRELVDGRLIVPTIRSRFSLLPRSPLALSMWLLGFYQAEGAKRAHDFGFELGNKSRVLLARSLECLEAMGIERARGRLTVLWGRASEKFTADYYRPLSVEMHGRPVKAVRLHDHAAVLTLRESAGFIRLLRSALHSITPAAFDAAARRQFLLGFLAGDGSVTFSTTDVLRASCGSIEEARLIAELMVEYLGGRSIEPKQVGGTFVVGRSLTMFHAVDLLVDGAFVGTASRPKLFHIAHRLDQLKHTGAMRRWGYVEANGSPTARVHDARARLAALDAEWAYVQSIYPTERDATLRRKGVLYEYPSMV